MLNQEFNAHGICAIDLVGTGRGNRVMLVQIDENSATLTPFGSLIRISPVKVSRGRSWTARLRAVLADLTWNRCCRHDRVGHDASSNTKSASTLQTAASSATCSFANCCPYRAGENKSSQTRAPTTSSARDHPQRSRKATSASKTSRSKVRPS